VKNNQLHLGVVVIFLLNHLLEEYVMGSGTNLSVAIGVHLLDNEKSIPILKAVDTCKVCEHNIVVI
jgi:hypothetical protein